MMLWPEWPVKLLQVVIDLTRKNKISIKSTRGISSSRGMPQANPAEESHIAQRGNA
jgi:hypothetical protein